ncbi:MAG TPA: crossover junction endodeoxyribonuclease RuvC [Gemmatimonadales bacterium]|jgi:crossover junction endodeoxyribonuclease RuvC
MPPVLGIDPGTAVTGYGVVAPANGRPGRLVECGVIRTSPKQPMSDRLAALYEGVVELLDRHAPGTVVIEGAFYAKNVRTTIALGQARGVILLAAARAGVQIREYAPAAVKRAVAAGGRGTKGQVAHMVQQLLRLSRPPAPSDAADGVALALTYLLTAPRAR